MDPKSGTPEAAPATVTAATETTSETTDASTTVSASATAPPWQKLGHEIVETILKNAEQIKIAIADMGIDKNKIDAAARSIAERLATAAVFDGIEYTRKRAKSAVITGDEMFAEMFPAFSRKSFGHKQPKKAKSTSKKAAKKAPEMPTDKAAKRGGENA